MVNDKEVLNKVINFRATEKIYKALMIYLKQTGDTISSVMRIATHDYLMLKKAIKENGYSESEPVEKKKPEIKVDLDQIEANKFCDGDSCEIPPEYLRRKLEKC